ncbi:hypothetical protein HK102_006693 [Quaeritorhiza haematococci]|nr:hypothetical protein HK102_006693 [Quaeritorhiza haematococci]
MATLHQDDVREDRSHCDDKNDQEYTRIQDIALYTALAKRWNRGKISSVTEFASFERRLLQQFLYDVTDDVSHVFETIVGKDIEIPDEDIRRLLRILNRAIYVISAVFSCSLELDSNTKKWEQKMEEERQKQDLPPKSDTVSCDDSLQQSGGAPKALSARLKSTSPLPLEIVELILANLSPQRTPTYTDDTDDETEVDSHTATLAACARVNKQWSSIARPRLWKDVSITRSAKVHAFFAGCLVSKLSNRITMLPYAKDVVGVSAWVTRLTIPFIGEEGIMAVFFQQLRFLLNLRELQISDCPSYASLAPLFQENLPTLRQLIVHMQGSLSRWWKKLPESSSSNFHANARTFFRRLSGVQFRRETNDDDLPVTVSQFVDVAHENLRVVAFPSQTTDKVVFDFLGNCSNALSAVLLRSPALFERTFDRMSAICTNLQALSLDVIFGQFTHVHGLGNLIQLRGHQLRYLKIGWLCDVDFGINHQAIPAITAYCRSLEYLELSLALCDKEDESSPHPDLYLDMVRKCGRTLKFLCMFSSFSRNEALLDTIAESCPNLEALIPPDNINILPPTKQQNDLAHPATATSVEGANAPDDNEAYAGRRRKSIISDVMEDSLANLVKSCKRLRRIRIPMDFEWSQMSSPHLKQTLKSMSSGDPWDALYSETERIFHYELYV